MCVTDDSWWSAAAMTHSDGEQSKGVFILILLESQELIINSFILQITVLNPRKVTYFSKFILIALAQYIFVTLHNSFFFFFFFGVRRAWRLPKKKKDTNWSIYGEMASEFCVKIMEVGGRTTEKTRSVTCWSLRGPCLPLLPLSPVSVSNSP